MESSLQFRAFFRLYAFGFSGFRVTGFRPPQLPRFFAACSRCFFFERFSSGINLSIGFSFHYSLTLSYQTRFVLSNGCVFPPKYVILKMIHTIGGEENGLLYLSSAL